LGNGSSPPIFISAAEKFRETAAIFFPAALDAFSSVYSDAHQGCQMVSFLTKNPDLGQF
jgi:hypothetical protein